MRLASQISIVLAGRGINTLVNLLFVPYLARALPLADYGTYGQTFLVVDFFKVIFAVGLAQIITVHLAKYKNKSGEVLGSNLFLGFLSGLLATALLYISADWIAVWFKNDMLAPYLRIYVWSIVFSILFESINSTLIFFGKVKQSVQVLVIGNLFKITFLVVAIQVYQSMTLVFIGLFLATILQALMGAFYLPRQKLKVAFTWLKEQLNDGLPMGLSAMATILAVTIDSFMVSALMGTESYAIYRNGIIQIPFLDAVYHSVAIVVMPTLAGMFFNRQKKEIVALKKRIIVQSAALIYPPLIFILVFHYPLIVTYLSEKYVDSALIFFWFNIIFFWRINYYQDLPLIAQKTIYIFASFFIGFLVNVSLNYLLIPKIGLLGAVASTVFTSVVVSGLLFAKTIQLLESSFSELVEWKKLLKILIIPSLLMIVPWGIYQVIPNLILLILVGGLTILASYFAYLKLNFLEKEIASRFFNKIPVLGKRLVSFIE